MSNNNEVLRALIRGIISETYKVRGYIKPIESFHSLMQLQEFAQQVLNLQKSGIDIRDQSQMPQVTQLINQWMPHLFIDAERYVHKFDMRNVMIFIEDFANHRVWSFKDQFGQYFPDIDSLKFSYFYTRGDIEPYVLLDEYWTSQFYGSNNNIKKVKHYTNQSGLENIQLAIASGKTFDISCFTSTQKEFFDKNADLLITLNGNVRAGFRSDVKSFAVANGRRACNLFRLGYPGNQTNICEELESCDEANETSIWNEYIVTPVEILAVERRY